MKAVWKKRWLKALRSGEYEQGAQYLKTPDGAFCCLGVLCDLAKVQWRGTHCKYGKGGLNEKGREFFGLTPADEDFFVRQNDMLGRTFKQIARSAETRV